MNKLRLSELRKDKNATQTEVAKYLNVSREAYSQYETGRREMNYETMFLLADYFSVSIDYLLGRYEHNPMLVNKNEAHIIELYRLLDERGKASIESSLNFEYEQSSDKRMSKKAT